MPKGTGDTESHTSSPVGNDPLRTKWAETFAWILARWSPKVLQDVDGLLQKLLGQEEIHTYISWILRIRNGEGKNETEACKALKKIGILQLKSTVHKSASKSLAVQEEQVIAGKKIVLLVPAPITPRRKKSVLTTGGGLPVQAVNPLKHTSLGLCDELNKPCSQPEYVNHFKPTLYHHHRNLNGDKDSSSPEAGISLNMLMLLCWLLLQWDWQAATAALWARYHLPTVKPGQEDALRNKDDTLPHQINFGPQHRVLKGINNFRKLPKQNSSFLFKEEKLIQKS